MARLVRESQNSSFQSWAADFLAALPSVTVPEITNRVRRYFRYREEFDEVLRTVEFMADQIDREGFLEGDCDDVSIFLAALFQSLGLKVRFIAIRYSHPTDFEHVYAEAYDGAAWIVSDATVQEGTPYFALERMTVYV